MSRLIAATLLLSLGTGCSEYGLGQDWPRNDVGDPIIEVQPLLLDFWTASSGETLMLPFEVRNVGSARLDVTELVLSGHSSFTLVDEFSELLLQPGEGAEIEVAFTPLEAGELTGRIDVMSTDPLTPTVPVDMLGEGLVPFLVITPQTYDFGTADIPCGDSVELRLQNTGSDTLVVDALDYVSDGQLQLREPVDSQPVLVPGAWTTVWVDFMPALPGTTAGSLDVSSNDPRGVVSAVQTGTPLSMGTGSDTFVVPANPAVDVLFAIDQSCSMDDDAASLAANFSVFIDEIAAVTSNWHLGVVTLDDGCFNDGVLTTSTANLADTFATAVVEGTDTEVQNDEALFQLVDRSLVQTVPGSCNAGFLRPGAGLHVIVVSDEPERSPEYAAAWTWDHWMDRFELVPSSPVLLTVSGVVDLDDCNEGASGYEEAIDHTGGEKLSICGTDWAASASALAAASLTYSLSFPLSDVPAPGSLMVSVGGSAVTAGWVYDPALNAVIFESLDPAAELEITYELASSCP